MTLDGVVALVLLELRLIEIAVAAGPFKVTVPVDGKPPATVAGEKVMLWSDGGLTVIVTLWVDAPIAAEICAVTTLDTGLVETMKVT
jgi:hypothetical protein